MRNSKEVIAYINELRKQQKMSISELSEKVGMAKSGVSLYFNGRREFQLNHAEKFAKALHTNLFDLLGVGVYGQSSSLRRNVDMTPFEKIKKYCKEHGTSIKELAESANLSPATVYGWKNRVPATANLEKIAKVMNVSISFLLYDNDENSNNKVDLNNNANLYFYDGKPIPKEDMEYVRKLLKHLGEARNN